MRKGKIIGKKIGKRKRGEGRGRREKGEGRGERGEWWWLSVAPTGKVTPRSHMILAHQRLDGPPPAFLAP